MRTAGALRIREYFRLGGDEFSTRGIEQWNIQFSIGTKQTGKDSPEFTARAYFKLYVVYISQKRESKFRMNHQLDFMYF